MPKLVERALVVEDDCGLNAQLCSFLEGRSIHVSSAFTAVQAVAVARMWAPDLLILDFQLPDDNAATVLLQLQSLPKWPTVIIASGRADSADAFRLAQLGARAFLSKPCDPAALSKVIDSAAHDPPDMVPSMRNAVGFLAVHEAQELLRRTMIEEALARTDGSRTAAARLLRVSRQLLQHMVRGLDSPVRAAPVSTLPRR